MKSKPVIPRELANQDVNEAVEYYLSTGAEKAALASSRRWSKPTRTSAVTVMRLLLDTHIFIWVVTDSRKLKLPARPDNPLGG